MLSREATNTNFIVFGLKPICARTITPPMRFFNFFVLKPIALLVASLSRAFHSANLLKQQYMDGHVAPF